jgi:hypothetical protein
MTNKDAAVDKAAVDVAKKDEGAAPVKPATVTRALDYLDRFLVLESLDFHIAGDKERSKVQGQYRLTKLNRLLGRNEVEEWRDACEYDVREADAKRIERAVAVQKGDLSSLRDADGKIAKVQRLVMHGVMRQNRRAAVAIEFEPRLDVLVQDALKAMPFSPSYAEDAVSLCERYGIKIETE